MVDINSSDAPVPANSCKPDTPRVSQQTWIALGILILTLAAYAQVMGFQFVTFDDPLYILRNPTIQEGLTWKSLRYAFTTGDDGSYLPLVWLSHAACVSLFHTWAGGHHLVNLAFHVANSLLLFYFLKQLTKSVWPSACVAFLFALHPLHVESVAWVAERKDVLSTFFWILTSWAYLRYVEHPSARRYVWMVLLFILGLLSKSMLVTLPVTLLLFDIWPLNRIAWGARPFRETVKRARFLIVEKIPLFVLSIAAAAATFHSQKALGAMVTLGSLPLKNRLGNAALATVTYLKQTFWPLDLSAFYPYTWAEIPVWRVIGATLLLIFITIYCIFNLRRKAFLAVGWFWYLITLLPVVGIIQVGSQAHADRYTYVPLIGIFIMFSWSAAELIERWQIPRKLLLVVGSSILGILFMLTYAQTFVWRDNLTLFKNALSLDTDNPVALLNMGDEYMKRDQYSNAYAAYYRALQFSSSLYLTHLKTGHALEFLGRYDEALFCYKNADRLKPGLAAVNQRIGHILTKMGKFEEAEPYVQNVLQRRDAGQNVSDPVDMQPSWVDWAAILASRGRFSEAIPVLEGALGKNPKSPKARVTLGLTLRQIGKEEEALRQFEMALALAPDDPDTLFHLGLTLTRLRRFLEARKVFERINEVAPSSPKSREGMLNLEREERAAQQKGSDSPSAKGVLSSTSPK